MKFLATLLTLMAFPLAPGAHAAPLALDAALRNANLSSSAGETYLRVTVKAPRVHLESRMPMNLAVVIDRSGSMSSAGPSGTQKMRDAIAAARFLVDQLDARDTLTLVSFDDGAEVLSPGERMTPANKATAKKRVGTLFARGGTDMVAGLREGIAMAAEHRHGDSVNRVILISDGVPNTSRGLVEMARGAQGQGIGVSTLGVGVDYNENLMTAIANAGNGGYYFVADAKTLPGIFTRELHSLMAVVAKHAVLKIGFGSGVVPVKVYGYDAQVGSEVTRINVGDLVGGQVAEVLLQISHPALSGAHPVAHVELAYEDVQRRVSAHLGRDVSAVFTADRRAVEKSVDAMTFAKAEQVKTAIAVNQAMDAYARGDKKTAHAVLAHRRAALDDMPAPPAAAPALGKAKDSLRFAEQAASGAPSASRGYGGGAAGLAAAAKSAKAQARSLER